MIDGKNLPHEYPRHYLSPDFDGGAWTEVEARFKELDQRPIESPTALRQWLSDWQELGDALDEAGSLRYVAMTCATDDKEAERAYLDFLEKIAEPAKEPHFRLQKRYTACAHRSALSKAEMTIFDRSTAVHVELFREQNIPLETEEARLAQRYQKTIGAMTVEYEGKEQTLQMMARHQEDNDRARREESWRLTAARRLQDKESLEDLFDQLLALRARQADNAGFPNFRDYMFRRKERFDYGPKDCEAFHLAVETFVVPLARRLQDKRRLALGLSSLRPWDLACDPEGRPPLRPFSKPEELVEGIQRVLGNLDSAFGDFFGRMRDLKLLDLDSRKGKAPGGYQTTFAEARLPFIFMNAVGLDGDVRTLLHEGGHALHAFLARDIPFSPYRGAPMEFCEVASMSMELMGSPHLGVFYADPREAARSVRQHLETVIGLLPWIATVDAFQHWIYLHPSHGREERKAQWVALRERFGGLEDWEGFEEVLAYQWHKQLHIFELPFYYIEYGIAQLGALQVWRNSRRNRANAVEAYKRGLSLGGSRTLPELFTATGIRFDFSEATIRPLMEEVSSELDQLDRS